MGFLESLRRGRGQSLVEFVVAVPIVLVLLFTTFELSRYYYTRLMIRNSVATATRFAVTGNTLTDPETGDPLTRAQSIQRTILESTGRFGVDSDDIAIDPPDGGDPAEVVTISLTYQHDSGLPTLFSLFPSPLRDYTIQSSMRNEPFFGE